MSKKHPKVRKRRHLSSAVLFPKKEARAIAAKQYFLSKTFPDRVQRQEYIRDLIFGLDMEPIIPDHQRARPQALGI